MSWWYRKCAGVVPQGRICLAYQFIVLSLNNCIPSKPAIGIRIRWRCYQTFNCRLHGQFRCVARNKMSYKFRFLFTSPLPIVRYLLTKTIVVLLRERIPTCCLCATSSSTSMPTTSSSSRSRRKRKHQGSAMRMPQLTPAADDESRRAPRDSCREEQEGCHHHGSGLSHRRRQNARGKNG